ncbi:hypothetical protein Tco_0012496 [Tanacetum coccineum]
MMRSIESFVPMGSEERVKRVGVQLEQESSKKQKIDVPVTEEKVKVHEAKEDMEALVKGNDTDSSSGTDIPNYLKKQTLCKLKVKIYSVNRSNKQQKKDSGTDEGAGDKSEVLDVPKYDSESDISVRDYCSKTR